MKAINLVPHIMHEARFPKYFFQGALSFKEVVERLTTYTYQQQLRKDEEKDRTLILEQF
jgi:hypothetical protein